MNALDEESGAGTAPAVVACPFLRAAHNEPDLTYPHVLHCELRRGRARAPSADELAWFCTNGCHHSCTTYRRWRDTGGAS